MTGADAINAIFEAGGAALTWMNVKRVWQDRGYAGIYAPAVALFTSWGIWNLYYYPHLGQWLSVTAGAILVCANLSWLGLMMKFGRLGGRGE